ncbi:MAG: hypothetical protein SPM09_09620 [Fibrobacter sp.]|uniref:hypothetical protein n=1 Tax=Fibrobacter sp. TaxID=35828 RepID=UPI002A91CF2B|nr:hypothetical protein [Fibrobacter sp.]MDY6264653.1 hypothetical protein [Fibrobacter sp.]
MIKARVATMTSIGRVSPPPPKKNTGSLVQRNRYNHRERKNSLCGLLSALGMLLEALDQEGSENAVHIPFILYFRRFIVFLKQRANFNKILLTRQG